MFSLGIDVSGIDLSLEKTRISDMRFIDLFCGIGGFHQALSNVGFECVFASDIDEHCRRIYSKNYGLTPEGDITKVSEKSIPDFDILCSGFPCQSFSKAGHRKGFSDDRGNLFFDICRIAEFHKPKYMLLENVRNLASHDNGNTWNTIRSNIRALGYRTYESPLILNALNFDVPQNRERVMILCKHEDLGELPDSPQIAKSKNTKIKLKDILISSKKGLSGKLKVVEEIWHDFIRILVCNSIDVPKFPIWTDCWDGSVGKEFYLKYTKWIDKNREFYNKNKNFIDPWLYKSRARKEWFGAVRKFEWQAGDLRSDDGMDKVLWTARGSGIRVKRPDYAPTLVALSQVPVYGPESRRLTARELLRLQSFPDNFEFEEKHIYKQVGNAVNVKMVESCARFLILGEPLFNASN